MHYVCISNETVNIVIIIKDKLLKAYRLRITKSLQFLFPENKVH